MSSRARFLEGIMAAGPQATGSQRAVASTRRNRRGLRTLVPKRTLCFEIEIESGNGGQLPALLPGEEHRVFVRIWTARTLAEAEGYPSWDLRDDQLVLALSCPGYPEILVECGVEPISGTDDNQPVNQLILHRSELEHDLEVDFYLQVPVDCERRTTDLELRALRPDRPQLTRTIWAREVEVCGARMPVTETAATWKIDLDPGAEHVAFLYVQEAFGALVLTGCHVRLGLPPVEDSIAKPSLSPASSVDKKRLAKDFVAQVRAFSRQQLFHVSQWFQDLSALADEKLAVVIVDQTDAEFPWEMLPLSGRTYLGGETQVTRWTRVLDQKARLRCAPGVARGGALRFLDSGMDTTDERQQLQAVAALPINTPAELLKRMAQGLRDVGFVYMACHGKYIYPQKGGDRYQALYLESGETVEAHQEAILHFDLELLERGPEPLPVIFVNACHSARLKMEERLPFGLPEIFLAKLARGYVGTVGAVEEGFASRMGAEVIARLSGDGRPFLPEVLRQLRQEAAEAFHAVHDNGVFTRKVATRFLFTYMYVYYGDPRLSVEISSEEAAT